MQYGPDLTSTEEETRAYKSWRNKYANEEARCVEYETLRVSPGNRRVHDYFDRKMVLRALRNLPKGATVLDIPCGGGRITRALSGAGFRPVAADFSGWMVRESMATAALATRADATRLPFADKSIDAAVCFRFMQAVPLHIRLAVIRELGRVARLVLINYQNIISARSVKRFLLGRRPLRNRHSELQAVGEVESAGLTVADCHYKWRFLFEDFLVAATLPVVCVPPASSPSSDSRIVPLHNVSSVPEFLVAKD